MTRKRPPKPLNAPPPKERKVRPKKPPTANKSVRLTVELWDRMEAVRKERGIRSRNDAIKMALEGWLEREPVAPLLDIGAPAPPELIAKCAALGREDIIAVPTHAEIAEAANRIHAGGAGSLVSTPPGAKMGPPRVTPSWDWAKPAKRERK